MGELCLADERAVVFRDRLADDGLVKRLGEGRC
jgi:hypothetical protein